MAHVPRVCLIILYIKDSSVMATEPPSDEKLKTTPSSSAAITVRTALVAVAVLILSTILYPTIRSRLVSTKPYLTTRNMSTVAPITRNVAKKVKSIETAEGAGAVVRRSIGTPALRHISPFLMLDHFRISEGAGFPDHPHRGMTTVTLFLEGSGQHEDFAGHHGLMGPGDVQWMNAGKGIMHAEMPVHRDADGNKLPDPVGLQLWVDLPAEAKKEPPSYQEYKADKIPTATPRTGEPAETEGSGWSVKVIAGESHGVKSPIALPKNGGVLYLDVRLEPKGRIFQEIPVGFNAFIYTLTGQIRIGNDLETHDQYHTMVLSNSSETGVWIENVGDVEARLALVAGEPLDQEVFQYGPFVMTNRAEIQQTLIDFSTGSNGFERAPGWKSKIGAKMM